jgi:lysozyme
MTNLMHISQAGLDLIKSFEGYIDRLPDGSCRAYLCPAKVWTIGWGCTEGVTEGMTWTKEQAETGLRTEMLKHENTVKKLVTVDLNQNEFDALVSFTYNVGGGALQKSSLLKALNKGDRDAAARGFLLWNKGGGRVLPGLVKRRQRESVLFLTPISPPQVPDMPQKVEASASPVFNALLQSKTILGALIVLLGKAVEWLSNTSEGIAQTALDAVHQITKLESLKALSPNAAYMGAAITCLGCVIAVTARLHAAKTGKIG